MTEAEWLECTDQQPMLEFLLGKAGERKLRLFTVACCRHVGIKLSPEDKAVIEVAELFADGTADEQQLREVFARAEAQRRQHFHYPPDPLNIWEIGRAISITAHLGPNLPAPTAAYCLLVAAYWTGPGGYDRISINARYAAREAERARQLTTIRCIFGNPFRPVALEPTGRVGSNDTVARIATVIYDEWAFDRLPILADALEEAGCTDADILDHCRQPGVHVRGCWVIDLLLGKS